MSEFLPIVAAVVTTVGTIIGGVFLTRRLAKLGLTTEQLQVNKTLRELAEVETQKRKLIEEDLARTRLVLEDKLKDTQHDLDDCERQLSDARAELRQVARRRVPRPDSK